MSFNYCLRTFFILMLAVGSTDAAPILVEAFKSSSYRYVLSVDPDLLGQYSKILGLGIPMGAVDPTAMTVEEMKAHLKGNNPDKDPKDFETELANMQRQTEHFQKHAARMNKFLNASHIPLNEKAFNSVELAEKISIETLHAVQSALWFGARTLSTQRATTSPVTAEDFGSNRNECFQRATQAYGLYLTRFENYRWLSQRANSELESKAFRLPKDPNAQAESLNPWVTNLLDHLGSTGFPCVRFLEEVGGYLEDIDFATYGNDRDRLISFDKLSRIDDDSSLLTYVQILSITFTSNAPHPISRYIWLKANESEKLDGRTSDYIQIWIEEFKKVMPHRGVDADQWMELNKERIL